MHRAKELELEKTLARAARFIEAHADTDPIAIKAMCEELDAWRDEIRDSIDREAKLHLTKLSTMLSLG